MNTRMILSLGLSALVFGSTMMGCTATGGAGMASASDRSPAADAKAAAKNDANARKALADRDAVAAIPFAEAAVALAPRDAAYRMTLAEGYLKAGRFDSARQAFADVLALTPGNGKAALDLSLAQTATGDRTAARRTLSTYASAIPVSDLGLALALSGDARGATTLLMQAARAPGADAKLRQNLALALALAGDWGGARIAASADMPPAQVDARMQQWAVFAQPEHTADQVASLLGVARAQDGGQPVALALTAPVAIAPVAAPAVTSPPVAAPVAVPVAVAVPAWAPAAAPVAPPLVAATPSTPSVSPTVASVVFAPAHEVVQILPPPLIRAEPSAAKVAVPNRSVAVAAVPASGDWYVQLGAYSNADVARDGWNRAKRRFASLGVHQPHGMTFSNRAGNFYRLSIGGFARADADRLCRDLRTRGGACFVRRDGGDRIAQWLAKRTEVAAR